MRIPRSTFHNRDAHSNTRTKWKALLLLGVVVLLLEVGFHSDWEWSDLKGLFDSKDPHDYRTLLEKEVSGCPGGFFHPKRVPEDRFPLKPIHLYDVAARQGPFMDNQAVADLQKKYRIPLQVIQASHLDTVPPFMLDAMTSFRLSNKDVGFAYYSRRTAEDFIENHFASEVAVGWIGSTNPNATLKNPKLHAFRSLTQVEHQLQYFAWCYLFTFGGIWIHSGAVPAVGREGSVLRSKLIETGDELVVTSYGALGELSLDLVAATPRHPAIGQCLNAATKMILTKDYGMTAESVLGEDQWQRIVFSWRRSSGSGAPVKVLKTLVSKKRRSACSVNAVLSPHGKPALWTRYPGFDNEWRRYRPWYEDDASAAWERRMMFGDPTVCDLFGFTLDQELGGKNRQSGRLRSLVDMGAVHPRQQPEPRNGQKIPFIIMQTNLRDRVPRGMRAAMQTIIDQNPEYEHQYYSDRRIREFIAQHFDNRTLTAFDTLIPGAFKADLFRYCFLYIHGGVFIDGDAVAVKPLSLLLKPTDTFVSAEDNGIGWIHNAFIACTPKHLIMKAAIDRVVSNVERRDYGANRMSVTGPHLLKTVFGEFLKLSDNPQAPKDYGNGVRLVNYFRDLMCMIGSLERPPPDGGRPTKEDIIFLMRFPLYRAEMRWYHSDGRMYQSLYQKRLIFKGDENSTWPPGWTGAD